MKIMRQSDQYREGPLNHMYMNSRFSLMLAKIELCQWVTKCYFLGVP